MRLLFEPRELPKDRFNPLVQTSRGRGERKFAKRMLNKLKNLRKSNSCQRDAFAFLSMQALWQLNKEKNE